MNPPDAQRGTDYQIYKRHGIWPIAQVTGWQAEIINPDGVLIHTTDLSPTKAQTITEAKSWLDANLLASNG